ncbi:hypothetical protein ScPMuIL_011173 [Solemya velum]
MLVLTTAILSVIFGIFLTLLVQVVYLRYQFRCLPKKSIGRKSQFERFRLPKELIKLIHEQEQGGKKETCLFINVIFQFLFKELKDTKHIRQWAVKKMNVEFMEMLQTTSGKLIDQITVREFSLGETFPIIHSVEVKKINIIEEAIEELDVAIDLEYNGGFQLAVDVDLIFGKWAYLSVMVTKLKGLARLQLTRHPYAHWSFAFYEEPHIEFSVDSSFEGRQIRQITSLIVNQIKRTIRKKHTLPNYKMRFRPFFFKPETFHAVKDLYLHGNKIGLGQLEVTVIECSRLLKVPADSSLYCTLSVDTLPWLQMIDSKKKLWEIQDVEVVRTPSQSIGLIFKEEFVMEKYEMAVVVDSVASDSPAKQADIRKGDILVGVGTTRITSSRQAARAMKNAGERFILRLERPKLKGNRAPEVHFVEESVSSKDLEQELKSIGETKKNDHEDFVNISFKPNGDMRQKAVSADYKGVKKGLAFLSSSTAIFRGQHSRSASDEGSGSKSNQSSPEVRRKSEKMDDLKKDDRSQSAESTPKKDVLAGRERRAHSDTSLFRMANEKAESTSGGEIDSSSDSDEELTDIRKTKEVPSSQEPIWNEKIMFDCDDDHKFLNICVWCKLAEKVDKHDRVLKPQKELLMGHVSLSLTDIALDCLMVLQGQTQQCVHLTPAENKAGASRAKFSSFYGHKGFEPNLCYGDITLGLLHQPVRMSDGLRKSLTRKILIPEVINTEEIEVSHISVEEKTKSLEEGRHDFTGTQFSTATYCHFCNKKIWLKVALQCSLCQMTCHKKCTEKCQTQTLCSRDGVKVRADPTKPWKAPVTRSQDRLKSDDDKESNQKSGLLSKIKSVQARHTSPPAKSSRSPSDTDAASLLAPSLPSPLLSPELDRKRRDSAPDNNDLADAIADETDILSPAFTTSFPRTRSSTSIQCLINQNAPPCLMPEELYKDKSRDSESSEDSEGEVHAVLQIAQKRRTPGQNLDEMVVMTAKEMGKELFAHLSLDERKKKLDATVTKLQLEIDAESEFKSNLLKREQETVDPLQRESIQNKIVKSEEKMEALMVLMLHYCAGLQHCLDQQEEERQNGLQQEDEDQNKLTEEQNSVSVCGDTDGAVRDFAETI